MTMTWVTLPEARRLWSDAESIDDESLTLYLESAHESCVAYAPKLADGAPVPKAWKVAQVMQAQAVWRSTSGETNPNGGELTVPVFPLDWNVRQQLRPKRGGISVR